MKPVQAKNILEKKYPMGKVSPSYFFLDGKYYSGVVFKSYDDIPDDLKANPLDRGLVCVSVDSGTGKIESYDSAHDAMNLYQSEKCEFVDW